LLCCIEASNEFRCTENLFVIRQTNKINNLQFEIILQQFKLLNQVIQIPDRGPISYLDYLKLIRTLKNHTGKLENIFVSEFRSIEMCLLANNIDAKNKIYLDDGTMTFILVEKANNGTNVIAGNAFKKILKKNLALLFGLRPDTSNLKSLFTIFNLDTSANLKIIQNDLNFLRLKGEAGKETGTYLIGGAYVEDDIICENEYMNILASIKCMIVGEIFYMPHRREKIKKLNIISNTMGFKIVNTDMPIELFFFINRINPECIIGFFSTALYSLSKIMGSHRVSSVLISSNNMNAQHKDRINEFYSNFNKHNIQVLSVADVGSGMAYIKPDEIK
jgi:hypothetical protein